MQVQMSRSEIKVPLIRPKAFLSLYIYLSILLIFELNMFVFTTFVVGRPLLSHYPSVWGSVITAGIIGIFSLVLQGWLLVWAIRQRFTPPPSLRISREGIFFNTLIHWDEIKALIPYNAPAMDLALGIALWNYEDFCTRSLNERPVNPVKRFFMRLNMRLNARTFRTNSAFLAQINIRQKSLSMSIDDLMREICTQFAAELHEYHISVPEEFTKEK